MEFVKQVQSLFKSSDQLPWSNDETVQACENDACSAGVDKAESQLKLAWALVHSPRESHVQRGLAMLQVFSPTQEQTREVLYLRAVGYYRSSDYIRCRRILDDLLKVDPNFKQGEALKKMADEQISKDGVVGVGIAAGAVAVIAGGLALLASGASKRG
eukprot:TRINITY_DN223_c0_g1_i1.p1 TRINITY_DN223_c0_g1~~TRINITY_DN223_c0_g1_i1.p1  ORF type:complete len:158 (-),score=32.64 TRINITY_DN223_c0_g1_i1:295-768(-)